MSDDAFVDKQLTIESGHCIPNMEGTGAPTNLGSILGQANAWTMSGDFQLLNWMNKLSQDMESRATKTTENLNRLNNNVKSTHVALDNVANSLTALQYGNQFVECRVQDDDETTSSGELTDNGVTHNSIGKSSSREMLSTFLDLNLKVLRNCHEKYSLDIDDSDEENGKAEKTYIFQPINPYNERPLPHIFGSKEWYDKWHVGLSYEQQDNSYSGDEISETFSHSSSSGAGDNDSYESNSECVSSFSAGNENFEVRNATSFGHKKVSNADPAIGSPSAHSSIVKPSSLVPQSIAVAVSPTRAESMSSVNSLTESSHAEAVVSRAPSIGKPALFKSNIQPYATLFADPEPPEDLGSTTSSTPSIPTHISGKPVNLFNDDDDDVFKHLVIAGSKRNDPVVVDRQNTNNIEKNNTDPPKASVSQIASVSSTKTSKVSDATEEGLFNSSLRSSQSSISKTPKNLFDDDDEEDDFLSAFIKKQTSRETSKTVTSSSPSGKVQNVDKEHITWNISSQKRDAISDDNANNIKRHDRINLFDDDSDDIISSSFAKQQDIPKIDDKKQESKSDINKPSISHILKSNIFDDDDDDDDFFKIKPSISSSVSVEPVEKEADQAGTKEMKLDNVSPQPLLKTEISKKSKLSGGDTSSLKSQRLMNDTVTHTDPSLLFSRNTNNNFIGDIGDTESTKKALHKIKQKGQPKKENEMDSKRISENIGDEGNILNEDHKMISPSEHVSRPKTPLTDKVSDANEKSSLPIIADGAVKLKPELSADLKTAETLCVKENIGQIPDKSNLASDPNSTERCDIGLSRDSINVPEDNTLKTTDNYEHSSKNYDFNSSLIFDEPPDDNDFFETLGKSSQVTNAKYGSFDLENELYPEPDLPKVAAAEKALEYKGLQLFSDIPPEDYDDDVPQKKEYTVFYDDFSETLLALGRNPTQDSPSHSVHINDSPTVDRASQHQKSGLEHGSNINTFNNRPIAKLQMPNININVKALLPGKVVKTTSTNTVEKRNDENSEQSLTVQLPAASSKEKENPIVRTTETEHILTCMNKNRVRAPLNRRPSTRRARQENYRKSMLEEELLDADNEKVQQNWDVAAEELNAPTRLQNDSLTVDTRQSPDQIRIDDKSKTTISINEDILKAIEEPQDIAQNPRPVFPDKNTIKSKHTLFDDNENDDDDLFLSITSKKADSVQIEKSAAHHGDVDKAKTPLVPNKIRASATASYNDPKPATARPSYGISDLIGADLSSNKSVSKKEVTPSYKRIFTDSSDSDDDLFAKLGSSKTGTSNAKLGKSTAVAKSFSDSQNSGPSKPKTITTPQESHNVKATKTVSSLFSDDSDDENFLKTSAKKLVPKSKLKASSSKTGSTSIFSDIDTDDDGDLFEANSKVTKNKRTTQNTPAAILQDVAEPIQSAKQTIADNPLADLL